MAKIPGQNAAAAGLRAALAEAQEALQQQAPSTTQLVRGIVLRSLLGPDADLHIQSLVNPQRVGAKAIAKSMAIPLDDVQFVLKALQTFLHSTAEQLAKKAAGGSVIGGAKED